MLSGFKDSVFVFCFSLLVFKRCKTKVTQWRSSTSKGMCFSVSLHFFTVMQVWELGAIDSQSMSCIHVTRPEQPMQF